MGEEKEGSAYCCRNCKLKLETIVKKILEMRELFYKTSKEKVKRLHLPTGESPLAKKVCVNKDSEQSAPVAKQGLVFAASISPVLDPLSCHATPGRDRRCVTGEGVQNWTSFHVTGLRRRSISGRNDFFGVLSLSLAALFYFFRALFSALRPDYLNAWKRLP